MNGTLKNEFDLDRPLRSVDEAPHAVARAIATYNTVRTDWSLNLHTPDAVFVTQDHRLLLEYTFFRTGQCYLCCWAGEHAVRRPVESELRAAIGVMHDAGHVTQQVNRPA